MKILWLIAARSGSKSIKDKNIRILGDKPLLAHRICSIPDLDSGSEIWISTDSKEYADIAESFGCKVPFIRPKSLASDASSSIDVVLHAMRFAEERNLQFDFIGLLEPTSPFVEASDLGEAIEMLESNAEATAIVAVRESRPSSLFIQTEDVYLKEIAHSLARLNKDVGRQNFTREITPSGGFYISRWNEFMAFKTFYTETTMGYLLDDIKGLEID